MQLLISVAGTAEARAALCGGADVIDAKDPRRGALGPVSPQRLRAIRTAIGSAPPLSAALGDAGDETAIAAAARAAARVDVWFVKVGFAGVTTETRAQRLAVAARRGLTAATAHGARLVLVAYADWRRAESLSPSRLIAIAAAAGAAGILLDTAGKDAPLFRIEPPAVVGRWVAAAH